jgi:hypothetical protein
MIKIKAKLKKCSIYPHSPIIDDRFDVEIEVDFIELFGYGEKIKHISGLGNDLETYHCWEHDDIIITKFEF